MLVTLSILIPISLSGFLFCLLKLLKIKKIKKTNIVEPIQNKKWRRILRFAIVSFLSFFILGISLFFSLIS